MGQDLRDGKEEGENIPGLGLAWAKVLGRERSFMGGPESGGLTRQGWEFVLRSCMRDGYVKVGLAYRASRKTEQGLGVDS